MATKRYAVFDKQNVCINIILVKDPLPAKYWPGYGAYLLCLDPPADLSNGPPGIPLSTKTPSQKPQIGDVMVPASGLVLRYVPQQIVQLDAQGQPVTVSSAPQVRLVRDVEPT